MPLAQLMTPQRLAERIGDPKLVVLDCRYALDDHDYGQRSYAEGHLAGAHFADLARDLSGPLVKGISGRHPLPDPARWTARLREWGVDADSDIVLYDDGPGAYAARAWWLLAWVGKREGVFILDGGLQGWHAAQLPLSLDPPSRRQGSFEGQADASLSIDGAALQQILSDSDLTLLDARAAARFRGEVEPIDAKAGHIPGAQCAAFTGNLGDDGRFLPAAALRARFAPLLATRRPEAVVAYCGSGVTACHNLFAMALAGYPLGRLYAGSWSEWINDPHHEVAIGD